MINVRIVDRPAFVITGKKTWIDGPDNESFGRFWVMCREEGLFKTFEEIKKKTGQIAGPQTESGMLGVSRVEQDPSNRAFFYMIAIEVPGKEGIAEQDELECYQVPASQWAVFECRGSVPDSIVTSEIYAFTEWLPNSGFLHAQAPEMEVYPARDDDQYCEFWLPIERK